MLRRKKGAEVPTEEELLAIINSAKDQEITAFKDELADVPLLVDIPEPGTISERKGIVELGITEWTLSNGVRVILKANRF